jgi:hypothetical protein
MAKSAKKPEAARRQRPDSGARPLPAVNKLKRQQRSRPLAPLRCLAQPQRHRLVAALPTQTMPLPVPSNRACWRCCDLPQAQRSRQ